jgi:hypothetical protein
MSSDGIKVVAKNGWAVLEGDAEQHFRRQTVDPSRPSMTGDLRRHADPTRCSRHLSDATAAHQILQEAMHAIRSQYQWRRSERRC